MSVFCHELVQNIASECFCQFYKDKKIKSKNIQSIHIIIYIIIYYTLKKMCDTEK